LSVLVFRVTGEIIKTRRRTAREGPTDGHR
jgi:hypothetical protein